jgi:hypothetical protein
MVIISGLPMLFIGLAEWLVVSSVVPSMVAVAQLVESRIVIPVVVGSSPISHPINYIFILSKYSQPLPHSFPYSIIPKETLCFGATLLHWF